MNNKTNTEKDIEIVNNFLLTMKLDFRTGLGYKDEIQATENILADREKYKQLYERALSDLVSVEKENEALKTKYEANNSKTLLTVENLKELEEHCKRQIQRYKTGKREKEEHLLILELLYTYQQNETKANKYDSLIKEIENKIKEIGEYSDIARELIEEKIIIAHSDSLNFGRQQAHNKDREVLRELLDKQKEENQSE